MADETNKQPSDYIKMWDKSVPATGTEAHEYLHKINAWSSPDSEVPLPDRCRWIKKLYPAICPDGYLPYLSCGAVAFFFAELPWQAESAGKLTGCMLLPLSPAGELMDEHGIISIGDLRGAVFYAVGSQQQGTEFGHVVLSETPIGVLRSMWIMDDPPEPEPDLYCTFPYRLEALDSCDLAKVDVLLEDEVVAGLNRKIVASLRTRLTDRLKVHVPPETEGKWEGVFQRKLVDFGRYAG